MSITIDRLLNVLKHKASDLAGIDVGVSGVKVVRMQKSRNLITLQAADILPPLPHPEEGEPATVTLSSSLPPRLKARYACLAIPGQKAVIKLLSFPGQFDSKTESKLFENLGLKNQKAYRLGYKITSEGQPRGESRLLAAAIPDEEVQEVIDLLPAGAPAPYSLEIAGLATLTAFMHGPGSRHLSDVVGVIEFGASISSFALFHRGSLALVRRFDLGTERLIDRLTEALSVDRDTAAGIITNNSFDISHTIDETIEPLIKQLVVSRDFVERRENCHVTSLYVSGGISLSHDAVERIRTFMGIEVHTWSPLENLKVADDALPEGLAGQEWRLASAIGACLGTFEET